MKRAQDRTGLPDKSGKGEDGVTVEHYYLDKGEWIRNPTTTSGRRIHGPVDVLFNSFENGSLDCFVKERGELDHAYNY